MPGDYLTPESVDRFRAMVRGAGFPVDDTAVRRALAGFRWATAGAGGPGIEWSKSPGITGMRMFLYAQGARNIIPYRQPRFELPPLGREIPHYWVRPLTPEERAHRFVIGFDVNGQYLAASSSVPLGSDGGEPYDDPFDRKLPGWWYVPEVTPGDGTLPPLVRGEGWYPTPVVEYLVTAGLAEPQGGYLFPHGPRPWLKPWQRACKAARLRMAELPPTHDPAATIARAMTSYAVKRMYSGFISWLGSRKNTTWLWRPDWTQAVRGLARTNQLRHLDTVRAASGRTPFLVSADAVYYVAGQADDVPDGLIVSDGLGKWKRAGAWELAPLLPIIDRGRVGPLTRALRDAEQVTWTP